MYKKLTPERRKYLARNPLTKLMRESGVTNTTLAEELEVHLVTVSYWKQGMTFPSRKNMSKLAEFFKVDTWELWKNLLEWNEESLVP